MNIFVARQPIFDQKKNLYGYELLFRDGITNSFPEIDGEAATSRVLNNSFLGIGMERLCEEKTAFINFPERMLLEKIPQLFPKEHLIIEILETVEPTAEIGTACRAMAAAGYRFALDDFVFDPSYLPLIELAKIIKVDFMAMPLAQIQELLKRVESSNISFLAEKIETQADFLAAAEMGFRYFQGYFFQKPEVIAGKQIESSKLTILQMLQSINQPDINLEQLENLINRDVALSYKLLRYINSAFFKRLKEISTIRQALVFLGSLEIKKFISLIATADLASDKPFELIRTSIIRAHMCEALAQDIPAAPHPEELFLVGLFSMIDTMLNASMGHIMDVLPLSPELKQTLIDGSGISGEYLALVTAYERGDWSAVETLSRQLHIDPPRVADCYMDAIHWADACNAL